MSKFRQPALDLWNWFVLEYNPIPTPLAGTLLENNMTFRYKKTEPHQHDWQYTRTSGSQLQCVLCGKYESEK